MAYTADVDAKSTLKAADLRGTVNGGVSFSRSWPTARMREAVSFRNGSRRRWPARPAIRQVPPHRAPDRAEGQRRPQGAGQSLSHRAMRHSSSRSRRNEDAQPTHGARGLRGRSHRASLAGVHAPQGERPEPPTDRSASHSSSITAGRCPPPTRAERSSTATARRTASTRGPPCPGRSSSSARSRSSSQPFIDSLLILRGIDNFACSKQGALQRRSRLGQRDRADGRQRDSPGHRQVHGRRALRSTRFSLTRLAQKNPVTFPSINLQVPAHNYGTPFYRAAKQPVDGEVQPGHRLQQAFCRRDRRRRRSRIRPPNAPARSRRAFSTAWERASRASRIG